MRYTKVSQQRSLPQVDSCRELLFIFRFKVCVCSRKRVLCTHNLTFANKRGCFAAAESRRHIYASRVCRCKSEVYFCSLKSAVLQLQAFACGLRGSFVAAKLILPVQKLCLPCSHRSAEVMLQLQSACFQLQISACSNERATNVHKRAAAALEFWLSSTAHNIKAVG